MQAPEITRPKSPGQMCMIPSGFVSLTCTLAGSCCPSVQGSFPLSIQALFLPALSCCFSSMIIASLVELGRRRMDTCTPSLGLHVAWAIRGFLSGAAQDCRLIFRWISATIGKRYMEGDKPHLLFVNSKKCRCENWVAIVGWCPVVDTDQDMQRLSEIGQTASPKPIGTATRTLFPQVQLH